MTEKEYLEKAKRTLSTTDGYLYHMIIGLVTESAELADALKKHMFYGRDLDMKNIREEIGDVMWYLVQLANISDYSLEQAMIDNIEKLSKRYPNKFVDVVNRDVEQELNHIGE